MDDLIAQKNKVLYEYGKFFLNDRNKQDFNLELDKRQILVKTNIQKPKVFQPKKEGKNAASAQQPDTIKRPEFLENNGDQEKFFRFINKRIQAS